jgi:hypothetical protein
MMIYDDDEFLRVIVISPGTLVDGIDGEIEEMEGDPIVIERVTQLLRRDCARRKLCSALLPAFDEDGRREVGRLVETWSDERTKAAGREVLQDAWQ